MKLPMNWEVIRSGIAKPNCATGTRIIDSGPRMMLKKSVGPRPMRAGTHDAISAPKSPPTAPAAKITPITPGVRCRTRYA